MSSKQLKDFLKRCGFDPHPYVGFYNNYSKPIIAVTTSEDLRRIIIRTLALDIVAACDTPMSGKCPWEELRCADEFARYLYETVRANSVEGCPGIRIYIFPYKEWE